MDKKESVECAKKPLLPATCDFLKEKVIDIPATGPPKIDTFDAFTPVPKTVLDYHIYQTDTKFRKSVGGGVAQIHVTQTEGLYKLPPCDYKFPKHDNTDIRIQYFTGGSPVWKFTHEVTWDKIERKQKLYKKRFRELVRENPKFEARRLVKIHQKLVNAVGPAWFQELSVQQMKTVDQLKKCILKDIKCNTIQYTQQNIGELGLVKLPRSVHIKLALDNCCECPTEFLLVLYQLINRKRTEYSINDRLLLSAVVHLTVRETLKELHVRIPSPPPCYRCPKQKRRRKVYIKREYKSPYLEPFTFEPCPRKHKGVYKNWHVQYPENPYFSYLCEFRNEMNFPSCHSREIYLQTIQSGITIEQHQEITKELEVAEKKYLELTDADTAPYLLKASIYTPCNFLEINHNEPECTSEPYPTEPMCDCTLGVLPTCNCGEPIVVDQNDDTDRGASLSSFEPVTDCKCTTPVTIVDPCEIPQNISPVKPCSESQSIIKKEIIPRKLKKVSTQCDCKELAEKFVQKASCRCEFCLQYRGVGNEDGDPCGLEDAKSCKETEINKSVEETCKCECLAKYKAHLILYEKIKERFTAQQELICSTNQYVVGGVTQGPDGETVYILSGVVPPHECSCLQKYQDRLKELEVLANMPVIPKGKPKYEISGVHPTNHGNVYVLSGAVAKEQCPCQKLYKSYQQRHSTCLDTYQKYVKKVETDVNEYMQEIGIEFPCEEQSKSSSFSTKTKEDDKCKRKCSDDSSDDEGIDCEPPPKIQPTICSCCGAPNSVHSIGITDDCTRSRTASNHTPSCLPLCPPPCPNTTTCDEIPEEEKLCDCSDIPICFCKDFEEQNDNSNEVPLYRYTIVDHIPCKYKDQMELIKKSLSIMAEDGFPLAKLPDSWKLPIFRLWMQMRARRYWDQEEKENFYTISKNRWKHIEECKMKMTQKSHFGMPAKEAKKYTRKHTEAVKYMVSQKEESFYREMKHYAVNHAREFFPTHFSYELYDPAFRDLYFAYMPCKEHSCHYFKPWNTFEVKNFCRPKKIILDPCK
ncbi:hypothetical protein FQR65_LT10240 [Abscondita terminalis]|nr:hypothetical protein FQR65_LT10240 [Abscondita terminalis]